MAANNSINLFDYLDRVFQSEINESVFTSIFNKFTSEPNLFHQVGTIWNGTQTGTPSGAIIEINPARQAYQLQPTITTQEGTEVIYRVYQDFLNRATQLGIDISRLQLWGSALQFNWVPPINFDKFINYTNYYWYDVENPDSTPQYITMENQCNIMQGVVDQYQNVLNAYGSSMAIQYIDVTNNTFTVNNRCDDVFLNGFVFFIDDSLNPSINQKYWSTVSSVYNSETNQTIITVEQQITQMEPMVGTIELTPLLYVFEAKRNCYCYGSVGWDYAQWDDNQVGTLLWNTQLMSQITTTTTPISPQLYQLWYNPTTDILYQYNEDGWESVQQVFSLILAQTSGVHDWDQDSNCNTLSNQWSQQNNWLYISEVPNFQIARRAQIPILEYSIYTQMNQWVKYTQQWYYRSTIYLPFAIITGKPSLFELIPDIVVTFINSNTILIDSQLFDLTNVFTPNYQFSLNDTTVTVISSEYISVSSNTLYQTQITFSGLIINSTDSLVISPLTTSQGDNWEGYNRHWCFNQMVNPIPVNTQQQNIYQTTFSTLPVTSTTNDYIYTINPFGQQITLLVSNITQIILHETLQNIALLGTNSVRVYVNHVRLYGVYTEIPSTTLSPSASAPTTVAGIIFDSVITFKPYDEITIYVGPDAEVDLGNNIVNVRTITSDVVYASVGNVYQSLIEYKIVDQTVDYPNQYPLFDMFDVFGNSLQEVSPIFEYATSNDQPISQYVDQRIVVNEAGTNYTFQQDLVEVDNGPIKTYRIIPNQSAYQYFWFNTQTNSVYIWDGTCWVSKINIPGIGFQNIIVSTITPVASSFNGNPYWFCSTTNTGYVYNTYQHEWISYTTDAVAIDPTITTIWRPGLTLQEYIPQYVNSSRTPVPINSNNGAWEIPHQLRYNPQHYNHRQITYVDMYDHCQSIINAQTAVPGLGYQVNTFFAKTSNQIDYGVGGTIKEFNGSYDTFISSLNIDRYVNTKSIILFAEQQYLTLIQLLQDTFIKELPSILSNNISQLYDNNISQFVASQVITLNGTLSYINKIFFDTTAYNATTTTGIPNWIATSAVMGFTTPVIPYIIQDLYTNINQVICHDGHRQVVNFDTADIAAICNNITLVQDTRTSPSTPLCIKSAIIPPQTISEYLTVYGMNTTNVNTGKFWYQNVNGIPYLYFFNVPLVGNVFSDYPPQGNFTNGTLWLDINTNTLRTWNGTSWIPVTTEGDGIITAGWEYINISQLYTNTFLSIEQSLYDISVQLNPTLKYNVTDYIYDANDLTVYYEYMIKSLLEFARETFNVDVNINTGYASSNAFSWNYAYSTVTNFPQNKTYPVIGSGCWQNLYESLFNTPYPHLEPWKLQGFTNIPSWWVSTYADTTGTRKWNPVMWENIYNGVLPAGITNTQEILPYNYIPVNTTTSAISGIGMDALLPPYLNSSYGLQTVFNSYSQIINPSADFNYINPGFTQWAWTQSTNFIYSGIFNAFLMQPVRMFHTLWGTNFIECNHLELDADTQQVYAHQNVLFHGDIINSNTAYVSNGINQWYMNFLRFYDYDLSATNIVTEWQDWNVKLGYQIGGLMDISTLQVFNNFINLTTQDYTVGYKTTDNLLSISTSSLNIAANHVPPKYITYNNQNEWTFTINTPSQNIPGPLISYGVKNYPVQLSSVNNSLLIPFMFKVLSVNLESNCFVVSGNTSSYTASGFPMIISGTTNLNGTYTMTGSLYNPLVDTTNVYVSQNLQLPIGSPDYNMLSAKIIYISRQLPFNNGDTVFITSTQQLPPGLQANYPYIFVPLTYNGFGLATNTANAALGKYVTITPTPTMGQLHVGAVKGTFLALNGQTTTNVWYHYEIDPDVINYITPPVTINGVQNVINFIDGYEYYNNAQGALVNQDVMDQNSTDRINGWQLQTEEFINWAYTLQNDAIFNLNTYPVNYIGNNKFEFSEQFVPQWGIGTKICFSSQQQVPAPLVDGVPYYIIQNGTTNQFTVASTLLNAYQNVSVIITGAQTTPISVYQYMTNVSQTPMISFNPFGTTIQLNSGVGVMAPISNTVNINLQMQQGITDQFGNIIPSKYLDVMRMGPKTLITIRPGVNIQIGTLNAVYNGYEHILVFNDYTIDDQLIFDQFIGVTISDFSLDFYRSYLIDFTPDMGGYFVYNQNLIPNFEGSTLDVHNYFSTNKITETSIATDLARQMIGYYGSLSYMEALNIPLASQFEFWKGMIHNKGTEAAITAFANSTKYTSAYIDEYWAIQIAEYGDAHKNVGIKIQLQASDGNYADLMFQFTTSVSIPDTNYINITPIDETRWYDYPYVAQILVDDFNELKLLQ